MFVIIPYPVRSRENLIADGVYSLQMTSKQRPVVAYTSQEQAEEAAAKRAEDDPGVNYAVMSVVSVVEAQKAEVKLVRKIVNKSGELVPEDGK